MLRKRLKKLASVWLLLAALAAPGPVAWAQSPTVTAVPAPPAPAASPRAAIWAATAAYVYADDKDLTPIRPQLEQTISAASLQAFSDGLAQAVALEQREMKGQRHVLTFQKMYADIDQKLNSSEPQPLIEAIVNKLDDNKERMADPARRQQFEQLRQHLNQLATGAPTPAAAPAETTAPPVTETATLNAADAASDNPMNNLAAPASEPVATASAGSDGSMAQWALGLSVLSLLGVVYLLLRRPTRGLVGLPAESLPAAPARTHRSPRASNQENISWEEIRKYVDRQLDERLPTAEPTKGVKAPPAPPRPTKPTAPAAKSAPPPPAKVDAAETAPAVAGAPEAAPAPDVAPAPPAPRSRSQYVNEAPFNNTFPARALSDQPGTYSMFVITSQEKQPDHGSFAVTGNLASHVRDHRSVLEPVCEYVGNYPLGSETRVITEEPGEVRRRGNDWEVTRPAKVRFE